MKLRDAFGRRRAADAPLRPPPRRRPMSRRLARLVDAFAADLSAAARRSRRR